MKYSIIHVLQPLFGQKEQPGHVEKFTAFTAEAFGGSDKFIKEMGGFLHLIDVHRSIKDLRQLNNVLQSLRQTALRYI